MLYTIYPPEMVLEEAEAARVLVEMAVGGRRILAARGPDGGWALERLLSTDPADYLNPAFQPGAAVSPGV
ncbi:YlzJ-like family protein [Limnochorda pilosa]|uniref:Uncharacterized protein n=1 Tax=Limnochorda pilosa TaxID=1555112 RepID=A0A0K2SMQ1_LIMPI|nr:YlzJ-like family protein [Limnochorda pilosa]BAS28385.1 hypothetical protein LIP_2555 [Limnochorda pilosa]